MNIVGQQYVAHVRKRDMSDINMHMIARPRHDHDKERKIPPFKQR